MGWDLVLPGVGDRGVWGADWVDVSQNAQFSAGTGILLVPSCTSAAGDMQLLRIMLELWWQKDAATWRSPSPAERLLLVELSAVPLHGAEQEKAPVAEPPVSAPHAMALLNK